VSGNWTLPGFEVGDTTWFPNERTQWASPAIEGDFQWTLVVADAYGQTATAVHRFASRFVC
jgi:hypothetical protein